MLTSKFPVTPQPSVSFSYLSFLPSFPSRHLLPSKDKGPRGAACKGHLSHWASASPRQALRVVWNILQGSEPLPFSHRLCWVSLASPVHWLCSAFSSPQCLAPPTAHAPLWPLTSSSSRVRIQSTDPAAKPSAGKGRSGWEKGDGSLGVACRKPACRKPACSWQVRGCHACTHFTLQLEVFVTSKKKENRFKWFQ